MSIKTISAAVLGSAAIGLSVSVASSEAATVTNPANGHQYTLTTQLTTWTNAQVEAIGLGGNLVTINDAAEEAWLKATFGKWSFFWIGLTDQTNEGVWQWISGQPAIYTNWAPGEPNDFGGEDYAVMNWAGGSSWNDFSNNAGGKTIAGIVEIESTPVPTPALLPGLIGMGVAALRKRKNDRSEATEVAEV